MSAADPRQVELAANLATVRAQITTAASQAGRDPAEVRLIVVTKTWPAADVVRLVALGVTDVGENRDQEAAPKAAEVAAALGAGAPGWRVGDGLPHQPTWHFVGQLQRNKCRSVVRYAGMVHSVDSLRLVDALDDAARRHSDRPLEVLVQVSLDGDTSRGGVPEAELPAVLAAAEAAPGLALRGLMAVAPLSGEADGAFERLARIAARVRTDYPHATVLSAGMSGDFEQAIRHGATHVRVGTGVLGTRPSL